MANATTRPALDKSREELIAERAKHSQFVQACVSGTYAGQLPLWEDYLRGIPNEIARCSLFNSRNRSLKRRYLEDEQLFVMGDAQVNYRGEELRQDDEIVWLQVLHLARMQPLNEWVEFVPAAFMQALGWKSQGQKNYERLRKILSRLQATSLQFSSKRHASGVSVSLVRRFEWRGLKAWRVWIEGEMKSLFPEDYYSRVLWQQRLELPSGIASKLHSYYASHRDPMGIKVKNIQQLCGSMSSIEDFKKSLVEALEHLKAVQFLNRFWIDQNDVLHVHRVH
jgi:hypothetical protein